MVYAQCCGYGMGKIRIRDPRSATLFMLCTKTMEIQYRYLGSGKFLLKSLCFFLKGSLALPVPYVRFSVKQVVKK